MSGSDPSWRPDEDPVIIYAEHAWLIGVFTTCLASGAMATLAVESLILLVGSWARTKRRRDGVLAAFVLLSSLLDLSATGMIMQLTLDAFVNFRNYPGGPAWYEVEVDSPVNTAGNALNVVSALLADALLVSVYVQTLCTHI